MKTALFLVLLLSTNLFAESADLTMFKEGHIDGPRLWLHIYNYGTDPARNIRVTVDFPAPLMVASVLGDATQCYHTDNPLRCTFDILGPNSGPRDLLVDFHAPHANATYTVTATVASDTPEANPANNVITHTFETRIVADLLSEIDPRTVRVDPGATQVFNLYVRNNYLTLPPGDLLVKLKASAGMTIEKIDAPLWTCTIQGGSAECRAAALDENCLCGREFRITTRANDDRRGGQGLLEANVTSNLPDEYEPNNASTATVQTYRHFVVNTNADAGEGSLREVIEQANQACSPAPCKILFEMPAEGLNTITPAVANSANGCNDYLDQRRVSGNSIVGNFRGLRLDDVQGLLVRDNVISDNVRSGIWSWNGKSLRILENRIERNGASGIFLGPEVAGADVISNTIAGHPDMGVAVAYGATTINVFRNAMSNNRGLGIDWGLDGVSPVDADDNDSQSNAPVLLSARYDAATNQTHVTMTLESAPLGYYPLWAIDIYANDAPDGDGEQWIGTYEIYTQPDGAFVVSVPANLAGKWLNATSTRVRSIYLELYIGPAITSELSNAVGVE